MPVRNLVSNRARARLLQSALLATLAGIPQSADAAVTPPWSTTFDCPQLDACGEPAGTDICDGLERGLTAALGTQIAPEANFAGGGGGGGLVWEIGDGDTLASTGPSGCGTAIDFASPTTEVWLRWHFAFEAGMPVNSDNGFANHKLIFMHFGDGSGRRFSDINGGFTLVGGGDNQTSTFNFDDFYDAGISDGTWHGVEVHIDTSTNLFEAWVYKDNQDDPTPILSTNANTLGSTLVRIAFPSNFRTDFSGANDGTIFRAFYDDVAISAEGRQGPVGSCPDADADGHLDASCGGADCDDANDAVGPSQPENCSNGLDDDCNGETDFADAACVGSGSSGGTGGSGHGESGDGATAETGPGGEPPASGTSDDSSPMATSSGDATAGGGTAGADEGGSGCRVRESGPVTTWMLLLPAVGFVLRRRR